MKHFACWLWIIGVQCTSQEDFSHFKMLPLNLWDLYQFYQSWEKWNSVLPKAVGYCGIVAIQFVYFSRSRWLGCILHVKILANNNWYFVIYKVSFLILCTLCISCSRICSYICFKALYGNILYQIYKTLVLS